MEAYLTKNKMPSIKDWLVATIKKAAFKPPKQKDDLLKTNGIYHKIFTHVLLNKGDYMTIVSNDHDSQSLELVQLDSMDVDQGGASDQSSLLESSITQVNKSLSVSVSLSLSLSHTHSCVCVFFSHLLSLSLSQSISVCVCLSLSVSVSVSLSLSVTLLCESLSLTCCV
jgi:hypothetical protein